MEMDVAKNYYISLPLIYFKASIDAVMRGSEKLRSKLIESGEHPAEWENMTVTGH